MEEDDNPNDDGLVVALLDFPRGGVLGLDGQNIVLRRDDFVGVSNLPPESVHLVTCKNGNHFANCAGTAVTNETTTTAATATAATNSIDTAVTVGFLVFGNGTEDRSHLVRRYDPLTEEVASEEASPIDELTRRNLLSQIQGSKSNSNENNNLLLLSRVLRCATIRSWREWNHQPSIGGPPYDFYCDDDDDDDDDGPVVVSSEEIEASMARSSSGFHGGRYGVASLLPTDAMATAATATAMTQLRRDYPMLAAAIVPGEDVLMTCARALDQRIDVSLVREAAAYLEEVEQYQHRSLF